MGYQIQLHTFVLLLAAVPVAYAAISDLRAFRIPNVCTVLLLGVYPVHAWLSPFSIDIVGALIVATITFVICFAIYATGRLGGGDVKLISALALWAGPALFTEFLVITTFAGGILSLIYLSRFRDVIALSFDRVGEASARDHVHSEKLPYGVAIACGGSVVLFKLAM